MNFLNFMYHTLVWNLLNLVKYFGDEKNWSVFKRRLKTPLDDYATIARNRVSDNTFVLYSWNPLATIIYKVFTDV